MRSPSIISKLRPMRGNGYGSDQSHLGVALALAEFHIVEGQNEDAVSLLERYLKDWANDSLHVKLALVFAALNLLLDALSYYQVALREWIQMHLKGRKQTTQRMLKVVDK